MRMPINLLQFINNELMNKIIINNDPRPYIFGIDDSRNVL